MRSYKKYRWRVAAPLYKIAAGISESAHELAKLSSKTEQVSSRKKTLLIFIAVIVLIALIGIIFYFAPFGVRFLIVFAIILVFAVIAI